MSSLLASSAFLDFRDRTQMVRENFGSALVHLVAPLKKNGGGCDVFGLNDYLAGSCSGLDHSSDHVSVPVEHVVSKTIYKLSHGSPQFKARFLGQPRRKPQPCYQYTFTSRPNSGRPSPFQIGNKLIQNLRRAKPCSATGDAGEIIDSTKFSSAPPVQRAGCHSVADATSHPHGEAYVDRSTSRVLVASRLPWKLSSLKAFGSTEGREWRRADSATTNPVANAAVEAKGKKPTRPKQRPLVGLLPGGRQTEEPRRVGNGWDRGTRHSRGRAPESVTAGETAPNSNRRAKPPIAAGLTRPPLNPEPGSPRRLLAGRG